MRVTLLVTLFRSKIQDLIDFTNYGAKKKNQKIKKKNQNLGDILMNLNLLQLVHSPGKLSQK